MVSSVQDSDSGEEWQMCFSIRLLGWDFTGLGIISTTFFQTRKIRPFVLHAEIQFLSFFVFNVFEGKGASRGGAESERGTEDLKQAPH